MSFKTSSSPGKLMLFGEHAVVYGYPCIVTAVDQRMSVSARVADDKDVHIHAPDIGVREYQKPIAQLRMGEIPKAVAFIEAAVFRFFEKHPQHSGVYLTTASDFSSQFGFGSSSAVTVSCIHALAALFGVALTKKQLFQLCYQAVLDVQGVGSGFDLAAAIWGQTLYYVSPAKVVRPVHFDKAKLIIGYTGIKADTPTIVRMVQEKRSQSPKKIEGLFHNIMHIVEQAEAAINKEQWSVVGSLMNENQSILHELGVSSKELDVLITAAQKAGAYGAKLSGAGGGDCMIALCDDKHIANVEQAIQSAGGVALHANIHAKGVYSQ